MARRVWFDEPEYREFPMISPEWDNESKEWFKVLDSRTDTRLVNVRTRQLQVETAGPSARSLERINCLIEDFSVTGRKLLNTVGGMEMKRAGVNCVNFAITLLKAAAIIEEEMDKEWANGD